MSFNTVPKLESTSTNWAIFKICFCDAVEAKGFWGHFNGTSVRPVAIFVTAPNGTTSIDNTPIDQWDKDERSAKSLLNQKIPDSTLMHIHSKTTVEKRWRAIEKEYTEKGAYAQTELRQKFLESKCQDKANVREFLLSRHVPATANLKVCLLTSTVFGRLCSSALGRATQW
jgi:gag-polypeptide of LTR copia-type